jgi:ribosomal protein S18 acetylase RimI-like enzyme
VVQLREAASLVDRQFVARLRVLTFCDNLTNALQRYSQARVFEDAMRDKTVLIAVGPDAEPQTGRIVGSADLQVDANAPSPACYVVNVSVHPRLRRQGLARTIMYEAEIRARSLGGTMIVLHVDADNHTARSLYQGIGYTPLEDPALLAFFSSEPYVNDNCPPQLLLQKPLIASGI